MPKWVTWGQKRLIDEAHAAGYRVRFSEYGILIWRGGQRITRGITLYPDGTATRADVDLAVANVLRTQKLMRKVLGI